MDCLPRNSWCTVCSPLCSNTQARAHTTPRSGPHQPCCLGSFRASTALLIVVLVLKSHLTLSGPMDCSLPGSSVYGISQARILEWVAVPSSRGSSQSRDRTCVSCISSQVLFHLNHQESPTQPPSPAPTSVGWGFHRGESAGPEEERPLWASGLSFLSLW